MTSKAWGRGRMSGVSYLRVSLIVTTAIVSSTTMACGGDAIDSFSVADSAEVVVATSSKSSGEKWSVDTTPSVQIGGSDFVPVVHRVRSALRLGDARILILNGDQVAVRLHDRSGRHIRDIGRAGEGPGEYREPFHISSLAGAIIVRERYFGPITTYDTSGNVVNRSQLDLAAMRAAIGDSLHTETYFPIHDRLLLIRGFDSDREVGDRSVQSGRQQILEIGGRVLPLSRFEESSAIEVQLNGNSVLAPRFFFQLAHAAFDHRSNRLYTSSSGRAEVEVWSLDGQLRQIIRKATPPELMTGTEYDSLSHEWIERQSRRVGTIAAEALHKMLPNQRVYPGVLGLLVDSEGYLWMRDRLHRWSIFSPDGVWVTSIDIPFQALYEVGRDYLLGLTVDADGIETVVELPLARPPRGKADP